MNSINKIVPPTLKICGLRRPEDVEVCRSYGVKFIGLNFFRGSKRFTEPSLAAVLASRAGACQLVGVFVDATADQIIQTCRMVPELAVIQLHGHEQPEFAAKLTRTLGRSVWKAVKVGSKADVAAACRLWSGKADLLLFDGLDPGSGHAFDWRWLDGIAGGVRWGIAGGINRHNITAAVATGAMVIDIASGAESSVGVKDASAIEACSRVVNAAKKVD